MDQVSQQLELASIATAMFSSSCLEDLLHIFLTRLGKTLVIDRIFIYHLTNQFEGEVLVDAISPEFESLKNHIYPIAYFGADAIANYIENYHGDRDFILPDTSQHWQKMQVKAMMSVPILFESPTLADKLWGLVVVQQCNQTRNWQPKEAAFLFETTQILSHCLQYWELYLRSASPSSPRSFLAARCTKHHIFEDDQEEFLAKRVNLSQDVEVISAKTSLNSDINLEEMQMSPNFTLFDDEENQIFNRIHVRDNETSIDFAINLAMQKLDKLYNDVTSC